jgi:23S rRNA (pseudouridine1915-N3)-methyltransferase
MQCQLLAVGQKMPAWCIQACQEYTKRLQHSFPTTLVEIPPAVRTAHLSAERYKSEEGRKILEKIAPTDYVIALEVQGKSWTSEQFAAQLDHWRENTKKSCFVIGGPDGLAPEVLKRAQIHWSLSPLVFPHAFVRLLVLEQLYRAMTILTDHPYHRA